MTPTPPPSGRRGVPAVYVDGSTLVQYLPDAPFRAAWAQWSAGRRLVTSQVGITELHGVAFSRGPAARAVADEVEASVEVVRFSDKALQIASHVSTALSSFVALHIGTAVAHADVDTVATYQVDLARVAALYQLAVVSPGWPDRWWENAS
ncbi:MAG TPA: PIN domain-containing protein [Cellulomonas sp.]